jgi:hypothetical protein
MVISIKIGYDVAGIGRNTVGLPVFWIGRENPVIFRIYSKFTTLFI